MDSKTLQVKILKLLRKSTIPEHNKNMVKILLPVMELSSIRNVYKSLKEEQKSLDKIAHKEKRIEMEYKVMMKKLTKQSK